MADPLHHAGIDPKPFGNDAHTAPPPGAVSTSRIRFSSAGSIGGRPRRLPSLLARASGTGLVQQSSPFEFGKDAQHLKDALPPGVVVSRPIFNACSSDRKPTKSGRLWPSRSTDQAMTISNSEALPLLGPARWSFSSPVGEEPKIAVPPERGRSGLIKPPGRDSSGGHPGRY